MSERESFAEFCLAVFFIAATIFICVGITQ